MSRSLLIICITLASSHSTLADTASFQGLNDLPGGSFLSKATGVSADGSVVVGTANSAAGEEAFRWTHASAMAGLGFLPNGGSTSEALAVSADGMVVVGAGYGTGSSMYSTEAYRWSSAEGMVGLGYLTDSYRYSTAVATSADGSVVVGNGSAMFVSPEPFRWTAEHGMVGLGHLSSQGHWTFARDVSADGTVVVGVSKYSSDTDGLTKIHAYHWNMADGMISLGDLPEGGPYSEATAVSANGEVIVGYGSSALGYEAFRWTADGGMIGLGDLPGGRFESTAVDVSANGAVIIGSGESETGESPFLWTAQRGMVPLQDLLVDEFGLDLTGWELTAATSISADGRAIVGYGNNAAGDTEAWIATIPEPATLGLLAVGGISLLRRRL